MKKLNFLNITIITLAIITLASCGSTKKTYIVPNAINTVNSVSLNELNLTGGDYQILNTISSDATIKATIKKNKAEIHENSGEFSLYYEDLNNVGLKLKKYSGVVRLGYLSNMYTRTNFEDFNPEEIAIKLASYRAINVAQQYGADGLIEPIISTKAEQIGDDIFFQTTVTAKLVKLKTTK